MRFAVLAVGAALATLVAAPAAVGYDIIDGVDCAFRPAGVSSSSGGEFDRIFVCVSDGDSSNGAEFYAGGELFPESSGLLFCGAVVAGGFTFYGNADWKGPGTCQ